MNKKRTLSNIIQKISAAPYMLWAAIFIIVPLFTVAWYAFTDSDGSLTLVNFKRILEPNILAIFFRSILFALTATFICLIIAYPLSMIISGFKKRYQSTVIMLVMLPMWTNFLLRTFSLMRIIEDTGIINNFLRSIGLEPLKMIGTSGAVIFGMVYNFLPYMILPIYSVMSKMDKSVIEAAEDLGCDRLKVLGKVIFPLSLPGVVSGITMVFVPSVSTFYISQKLGGGTFDLIGDTIERQFTSNFYHFGAAISFVLMLLILLSMAIMNKFTDEEGGGLVV